MVVRDMTVPAKGVFRPNQFGREDITIFDENGDDVTPLPLRFAGLYDEQDATEEEAILDTFQDIQQVVRHTTESHLATPPPVRAETPAKPAAEEAKQEGEEDGDEAEAEEEVPVMDDAASTPPPRIPTPILEALQAIRHYQPPPEQRTTFFLKETPTFWLLQLPSKTMEWGTDEAARLRKQDGHYFWLTYDLGRRRHLHDAETQTPVKLTKKHKSQTVPVHSSSVKLFATEWDLFDTFRKVTLATKVTGTHSSRGPSSRAVSTSTSAARARTTSASTSGASARPGTAATSGSRAGTRPGTGVTGTPGRPDTGKTDGGTASADRPGTAATSGAGGAIGERPGTGLTITRPATGRPGTGAIGPWAKLVAARARESRTTIIRIDEHLTSPRRRPLRSSQDLLASREFRLAATICERLLASNSYRRRQELFVGHPRLIARMKRTEFRYAVTRLFELFNSDTEGMSVTGLAWNGRDRNILAVGYGCYFLHDNPFAGFLCCWSVKNPFQPERIYRLDSAVTALNFSTERPNLLAVGLYSGQVLVVDVSLYAGDPRAIRVLSSTRMPMAFAPMWDVRWFHYTDFVTKTEEIITVGDDGWVCKWNIDKDWESYPLTRLQYYPDRDHAVPLKIERDCVPRVLSGLSLTLLPGLKGRYLVGTKEGVVVECCVAKRTSRPSMCLAHTGPVYSIQKSPFCPNVYLTAGADWVASLWVCGWDQPLLHLRSPQTTAMEDAAWSPTHPTIIATVSGKQLQLWDIARRARRPVAEIANERGARFTRVGWTRCGQGLGVVAGDRAGHTWMLHLSDLPHQPRMPKEALFAALRSTVPANRLSKLRDRMFQDDC